MFDTFVNKKQLHIEASKAFRGLWLAIFGILEAFLHVNKPMHAQADGYGTDEIYDCSLQEVVPVQLR